MKVAALLCGFLCLSAQAGAWVSPGRELYRQETYTGVYETGINPNPGLIRCLALMTRCCRPSHRCCIDGFFCCPKSDRSRMKPSEKC